jgi:hypothetical protein
MPGSVFSFVSEEIIVFLLDFSDGRLGCRYPAMRDEQVAGFVIVWQAGGTKNFPTISYRRKIVKLPNRQNLIKLAR